MDDNRIVELFNEIEAKTKAKKLVWQETASPGVYVAPMGGKYALKASPFTGMNPFAASIELIQDQKTLAVITHDVVDVEDLNKFYAFVKKLAAGDEEKLDEAILVLKNL